MGSDSLCWFKGFNKVCILLICGLFLDIFCEFANFLEMCFTHYDCLFSIMERFCMSFFQVILVQIDSRVNLFGISLLLCHCPFIPCFELVGKPHQISWHFIWFLYIVEWTWCFRPLERLVREVFRIWDSGRLQIWVIWVL